LVKPQLVINSCRWDRATELSSFWGIYYVRLAKELGLDYVELQGDKAVKTNFDKAVKGFEHAHVCNTGHGNRYVFTGQKGAVLLDVRKAADLAMMAGRSGAYTSCQFGQSMKTWLENRTEAFMGSQDDFTIVAATPARDDATIQKFGLSEFAYTDALCKALLQGRSYAEADAAGYKASCDKYDYYWTYEKNPYVRQYLYIDKMIKVHGPGGAGPGEQPPPPEPYARTTIIVDGARVYDESKKIPIEIGIAVKPEASPSVSRGFRKWLRRVAN